MIRFLSGSFPNLPDPMNFSTKFMTLGTIPSYVSEQPESRYQSRPCTTAFENQSEFGLSVSPIFVGVLYEQTELALHERDIRTSIVQEVKKLQNQGVNIFDYIRIKIGNGDNTSFFWKDKGHNEGVLKDVFSLGVEEFSTRQSLQLGSNDYPLILAVYSWLRKYRLDGMWITLMFLLMWNGILGWYLLGFRQISKRCSKASSIVYGGRFGCSVTRFFSRRILLHRRGFLITLFLILIIGVSLDVKPRSNGSIGSKTMQGNNPTSPRNEILGLGVQVNPLLLGMQVNFPPLRSLGVQVKHFVTWHAS
ncbi:hypothetical protein Tco_0079331 [Tanacetum coccineum]